MVQHSDTKLVTCYDPDPGHRHGPWQQHGRTKDPDMVIDRNLGQALTMVSGGCIIYPDCHGSSEQHSPWTPTWPRLQALYGSQQ